MLQLRPNTGKINKFFFKKSLQEENKMTEQQDMEFTSNYNNIKKKKRIHEE